MSEPKTSGLELLVLILLTPFTTVWNGLVLVRLWDWFAVPIFNLRHLRIPEAIGVSLVLHFMTSNPNDAKEHNSVGKAIGLAFVVPLFALFYGWIIHLFL